MFQVVGRLPFDDTNHKELLRQVTRRGPQFPAKSDVSKDCRDLVTKILVKRQDRLSIPQIKKHKWYNKLAPPPPQIQELHPDDLKRPMSKVLKASSTMKTLKPVQSRPMSSSGVDTTKESEQGQKKSLSHGQNVDKDPYKKAYHPLPRDSLGGKMADSTAIKTLGQRTKKGSSAHTEFVSAYNVVR